MKNLSDIFKDIVSKVGKYYIPSERLSLENTHCFKVYLLYDKCQNSTILADVTMFMATFSGFLGWNFSSQDSIVFFVSVPRACGSSQARDRI